MREINFVSRPLFSNQFYFFKILKTYKHTDSVDQAVSPSIDGLYNYIEENTVQSDG